ncbi:globin domain-containing protein [Streptomyces sp. 71268]|uniref:globin domain-containing protein n=1 Tax=Streptomyces sp. 71268 TaxID=3002640 RepID=UPI0023F8807F|nr:globin domain-containing protein [Streptomyces sp. 71268]WEV27296.1 globin domain-containing protein [Streptomyces sp. 71268]
MLSEKSAVAVRATLPAVHGALDEIAARFYDRLFAAHPALLRDLFNRGNQANGTQRQALAGALAAFATTLVGPSPTAPDELLGRIAHKHASLGVTRDQYDIVHTHLFAAIAEVLGEAVTEEVAAAWDEVYWLLADSLIAAEGRLYAAAGVAEGDVWREYRVLERTPEADGVVSFLVRPADGTPPPPSRPGQYVSVQVELEDGARQIRQYSVSAARPEGLRLTVKAAAGEGEGAPDGAVSTHLHARVRAGDTLRVSLPFGDVTLDARDDGPLLLVSAGIGCTPLIGMLDHLLTTGAARPVVAVHGDRAERTHAFREELDALVRKLPDAVAHVWYEEPAGPWPADRTGRVDLSAVPLPNLPRTTAYLCGPLPFVHATRAQLRALGLPADRIHYEVFGPDLWRGEG